MTLQLFLILKEQLTKITQKCILILSFLITQTPHNFKVIIIIYFLNRTNSVMSYGDNEFSNTVKLI